VLFDLCDSAIHAFLSWRRGYFVSLQDRTAMAANTFFYRCVHFMMCLVMISGLTLTYIAASDQFPYRVISASYVLRLIVAIQGVWSLLYFVQVVPGLGVFIIIIMHMLGDLASFLFVFLVFLFPFSHIFLVFLKSGGVPPCYEAFSNYMSSFYSTFQVMLNTLSLQNYEVEPNGMLMILHFTFYFVVAVLLINFLIALFSDTVSRIMVNQDIYFTLEKTAILNIVQSRVSILCPWLRRLALRLTDHSLVEVDGVVCLKCEFLLTTKKSSARPTATGPTMYTPVDKIIT
jgi:hypothetical protein